MSGPQTRDPGAKARRSNPGSPLHRSSLHDSGYRHTTGEALYVDDLPLPAGSLVGYPVLSPHAHARILSKDTAAASAMPGVARVLTVADVPGTNLIGPIVHDEPLFAEDVAHYHGQVVAVVLADTLERARLAAAAVVVQYEELPAVLGIPAAIAAESYLLAPHTIARGDVDAALGGAAEVIEGEVSSGFQDHFYLETQATLATPGEDGTMHLASSTQHPTEVQAAVSHVLGCGAHKIVCEVPRMGGAFGGKESQATAPACYAALGAHLTGRPVKVWFNRDLDMIITGKRHPFWSRYRAGFDAEGRLLGLAVEIYADGGWSLDLTGPIVDRALFHLDNAYFIEHLRFVGRACRTNVPSNTAFRGFGGPQGMLVVEDALNRWAERHGEDPAMTRQLNYYGPAPRDRTPYGQVLQDVRLEWITDELLASCRYVERRAEAERFNASSRHVKRGLGFQPIKFGISFTKAVLNQAGALVLVYADGTVQLNHGGTEMGQGLHTKMRAICAHELGVTLEQVRVMHTATDKVPNTSATAASSGSDLNGAAVKDACEQIRERMRPVAAGILGGVPTAVRFQGGEVMGPGGKRAPIAQVATQCWLEQVPLSATGFYRTPGIWYDADKGQGEPFYYFAYGGAVVEVEVHGLTGEHRVTRVDILHDVGRSLVPSIDRGQVEGGFIQGLGWLTCEEVLYSDAGAPLTTGPSTYKIPAMGDAPLEFRVDLLSRAPQAGVVHGSKAVGEPPFMHAIGAVTALRHAIAGFGPKQREVQLALPATPEAILRAVEAARA